MEYLKKKHAIPSSEEELLTGLAKLYAARVPLSRKETLIPYRDTVNITAMARDRAKREELKEVFKHAGLLLHSEEELQLILAEAEARGKATVSQGCRIHTQEQLDALIQEAETRGREAALRSSVSPGRPVVTVTSTHQEGQPQSILINTGGAWGLHIEPVRL